MLVGRDLSNLRRYVGRLRRGRSRTREPPGGNRLQPVGLVPALIGLVRSLRRLRRVPGLPSRVGRSLAVVEALAVVAPGNVGLPRFGENVVLVAGDELRLEFVVALLAVEIVGGGRLGRWLVHAADVQGRQIAIAGRVAQSLMF